LPAQQPHPLLELRDLLPVGLEPRLVILEPRALLLEL
jgi:hypothetical protein